MTRTVRPLFPLLLCIALVAGVAARVVTRGAPVHVVGNVRVSALSETLVRLEERGPQGFEDRATFHVTGRTWPGAEMARSDGKETTTLTAAGFSVELPVDAPSLVGVKIFDAEGHELHTITAALERSTDLPSPSNMPIAWLMPDSPRLVPPPWGATPAPENAPFPSTSGWDTTNNARDLYVFFTQGDHAQLRREFLALTGRIPIPPLYTFGYWTSRWHAYSEESALAEIDEFRRRNVPLDLFVVDTDWRVGASDGYAVNPRFFPDIKRFIDAAHARHVRLLFNDHPEPASLTALAPEELRFRFEGLGSLLSVGADAWWYDRNWHTVLHEPMPGLRKEVWGMRMYQDITQRMRPNARPLIMSNVDGIRSGRKMGYSDVAAHRFPIWWTGDTYAEWPFLKTAVVNGVNEGIGAATPYVNDDCGGHFFRATPELFTRFMQFCSLSPVLRPHASTRLSRLPWDFDDETLDVVRRFALLRYRLLPTIYSAAHRAYDDGMPLLRRADLLWPKEPDAVDPTQYLLGDDLLVAPILEGLDKDDVLAEADLSVDGKPGVMVDLRRGTLDGQQLASGVVKTIAYRGWPVRQEILEGITGTWTTTWTVPESGEWVFRLIADGHGKLFMDDALIADDSLTINDFPSRKAFQQGQKVKVRLEISPTTRMVTGIVMAGPPAARRTISSRSVWIPPGEWENAWTGERVKGPVRLDVTAARAETPMFVRVGGAVLTTREMQYSKEHPWDPIVVDAFVGTGESRETRTLYEDDGETNAYLQGASRTTDVELRVDGKAAVVTVHPAKGAFAGALDARRWTVRLHLPPGAKAGTPTINGQPCTTGCRVISPTGKLSSIFESAGSVAPKAGPVVEALVGPVPAGERVVISLMRQ